MSLKGKPDKMNKNELIEKIKEEKLIAIVRELRRTNASKWQMLFMKADSD